MSKSTNFFFHYFLHYSNIVKYQTFLTNPLLKKSSFFISYSSYLKPSFVTNIHTNTYHTNIDLSLSYASLINSYLNFLKKMQKAAETEEPKTEPTGHTTPHPSDVLDMPVDPNEPTYCVCQQVSYGEMIGCDNTEVCVEIWCSILWKHGISYLVIISVTVPHRMVPFRLRWFNHKTERQMVLSEVFTGSQEKISNVIAH